MAATPDDAHAGEVLLVITIILTIVAFLSTVVRLYVRWQRNVLGWDDYLIGAATGLALGRSIIQIVSVTRGNGKHHWQLSVSDYAYVLFCGWLTQLFLFPMLALLKTSICLLVLRIKDPPRLRYFLWGVIVGLILTNLLPEIVLLAECSPVDAYWKGDSDKCWNPSVRIYSIYLQTAYSVTTDLMCSLLPIYVVWDLQMSTLKKVGIWSLMSLGLISTAFALLRASTLGLVTSDLSFDYCWTSIWANIEVYVGIIAANLSLCRIYYGWFKDTYLKSRQSQRTSPHSVEAGSYPLAPYSGTKSAHSVQVRGRRSRRDSSTPSEESQLPFGITREVQYSVTEATHDIDLDDHESRLDGYRANQTPSLPNLNER